MRKLILIFVLIFSAQSHIKSQTALTWEDLKDVTYTKDYDPDYGVEFYYPTFGTHIETFDTKEVFIKGFLIPIEVEDGLYALSSFPYQSCFFCGKAGPETVIQLNLSSKRRYLGFKMDQVLTFKGTFKLNRTNTADLIYILDEAELYYGK